MAKPKNLVIVESPAKAKTIGKYLGSDYTVKASMGHLRDLPKSKMGVDLETFEPQYIAVRERSKLIKELKTDAKNADKVYLATDPDREGEAISWHLKTLLDLSDDKARRVSFNEITKKVVTESIKKPRDIDINLVDAQQARRILDRIVGYELSPLLWRIIKYGLSAGRVQSVATRMVVDRENEIRSFVKEEYWLLDAKLSESAGDDNTFVARYYGEGKKKKTLRSEEDVKAVIAKTADAPFIVNEIKRQDKSKSPAPPFITSTLQQEASRRLNMTPRRTMMIAQQLYEGIEIADRGTTGLITYMRTDSLRISAEALSAAGSFIKERYGPAYYSAPRRYRSKSGAQDAHEAIRPTDITLTPEVVRGSLTREQYSLYRLIWGRFTASQMTNATYEAITVDIGSAGSLFRAGYSEPRFKGYTALYEESRDEESSELSSTLPELREGQELFLRDMTPDQQFTQPPVRYTEATLIRAMEEKGIGRPSTYAATVSTITSHEYVIKEGKYLQPTVLGEAVNGLLVEHFADILDLGFTSEMESGLDKVESGDVNWKQLLSEFYDKFKTELDEAEKSTKGKKIKIPDPETDEPCELCGTKLVQKKGRFGYFLACPRFPDCTFTKPIVIEAEGRCPKCGGKILKRSSKSGNTYYSCEENKPECSFRSDSKPAEDKCPKCGGEIVFHDNENGESYYACEKFTKRACDFITWEVPTKDFCPKCGKTLFKRAGRGQAKTFCENENCGDFVPRSERMYKKRSYPASKTKKTAVSGKSAAAKKSSSKSSSSKKS